MSKATQGQGDTLSTPQREDWMPEWMNPTDSSRVLEVAGEHYSDLVDKYMEGLLTVEEVEFWVTIEESKKGAGR
jgi:hypothetical protein